LTTSADLGSFLTSPLGANLDPPGKKLSPRSELCSLGVKLSPGSEISVRPSILLNTRECGPLGVNKGVNVPSWGQSSPLGDKVHPRGQCSPLGAKFTPRGKLYPWGQTNLLKTGLWLRCKMGSTAKTYSRRTRLSCLNINIYLVKHSSLPTTTPASHF
jgi:hypothetical protein